MKKLLALLVGVCLTTSAWGITLNPIECKSVYPEKLSLKQGNLIRDSIYSIINPGDIVGFWVFNSSGDSTSVQDLSPKSHPVTLGRKASYYTRGVVGNIPFIRMEGAAVSGWLSPDNDDFTPSVKEGLTVFVLASAETISSTGGFSVEKRDVGANSNCEWAICDIAGSLYFIIYGDSGNTKNIIINSGSIANKYLNKWTVYAGTWSAGTTTAAGLELYINGIMQDSTETNTGAFADVANGSAPIYGAMNSYNQGKIGCVIIVRKGLSQREVRDVSKKLLDLTQ